MGELSKIEKIATARLVPYEKNAKKHPRAQLDRIRASIKEFGFISPCLIDKDLNIIAGHGRVMVAKELGIAEVPCVFVEGLTDEQRRAYILADNRLTELGGWDEELRDEELRELFEGGFDIGLTGFDIDFDKLDEAEGEAEKHEAEIPESRVYVFAVSAFGANSEAFVEEVLPQEEAERLLARPAGEIAAKIREALNAI